MLLFFFNFLILWVFFFSSVNLRDTQLVWSLSLQIMLNSDSCANGFTSIFKF